MAGAPPALTEHLCVRARTPPPIFTATGEGEHSPCCSDEETEAQAGADTPPRPRGPRPTGAAAEGPRAWRPGPRASVSPPVPASQCCFEAGRRPAGLSLGDAGPPAGPPSHLVGDVPEG